ncbi:beta-propeller fold lactonase family protein [Variovorax sp. J2P1-59]|uniref:lactonase family protein n=1 Tax=Variovorax flavidus TaxID=3053501 RepID=UPI0025756CBC|nr:beta-propeller fold lactonase family protein [Variovorax sp. J2P1-59]MDM0078947.1 beta-propeller fold lactonase family protein [Variovorax sp. J2P1-59]
MNSKLGWRYELPRTTGAGASSGTTIKRAYGLVQAVALAGLVAACGGGSNPAPAVPAEPSIAQHAIGGLVAGLTGKGLVLQNNAGEALAVNADGTFNFASKLDTGKAYAVMVKSQPTGPTQVCSVNKGAGTVADADINDVAVICSTSSFAVGGSVVGLQGTGGLVLQNNAGNDITLNADGRFVFVLPVASNAGYAVSVKTQPTSPAQTCSVSQGTGKVTSAAIDNVVVTCSVNAYPVFGTLSGLLSGETVSLQNNGADTTPVSSNGTFEFLAPVASAGTYAVTVSTQPASQTCTVVNGAGTVGNSAVTNVAVQCSTNTITVSGTVTGLQGSGLVLQNNAGDDLARSADGVFTFATPVAMGSAYAVTVKTQPAVPAQACTVANGSGLAGASKVIDVSVTCAADRAGMMFVGHSTASGVPGIQPYAISTDPDTFSTTALPPQAIPNGVVSLAVDEARHILYAATNSGITSYDFTSAGLSSATSSTSSGYPVDVVARDPLGRSIFIGSNSFSLVGAFLLDTAGKLGSPPDNYYGIGTGTPLLAVDPTGRFLYKGDVGSTVLAVYPIQPDGSLNGLGYYLTAAVIPSAIAVDPGGKHLYVVGQTGNTGYVYPIDQTTGQLGAPQMFSTGNASPIAFNPAGTLMFTVNVRQLLISTINPLDGAPTLLAMGTTQSTGPVKSLKVDPGGGRLFVGGPGSVEAFDVRSPAYDLSSLGWVTTTPDSAPTLGVAR